MMTSSPKNEQPSHVRFRGPDDDTIRSAWSTTSRSFKPPSPAERKPTIGPEALAQAKRDAFAVTMDQTGGSGSGSSKSVAAAVAISKPSALKQRAQTVPILKVGYSYSNNIHEQASKPSSTTTTTSPDTSADFNEDDTFDIDAELFSSRTTPTGGQPQIPERTNGKSRSAWTTHEARHSASSVLGPTPARRQKTLDEVDLREAAAITAMADSLETNTIRDTNNDDDAVGPRDPRW